MEIASLRAFVPERRVAPGGDEEPHRASGVDRDRDEADGGARRGAEAEDRPDEDGERADDRDAGHVPVALAGSPGTDEEQRADDGQVEVDAADDEREEHDRKGVRVVRAPADQRPDQRRDEHRARSERDAEAHDPTRVVYAHRRLAGLAAAVVEASAEGIVPSPTAGARDFFLGPPYGLNCTNVSQPGASTSARWCSVARCGARSPSTRLRARVDACMMHASRVVTRCRRTSRS